MVLLSLSVFSFRSLFFPQRFAENLRVTAAAQKAQEILNHVQLTGEPALRPQSNVAM